jgi:RNA polymerase sigma factor (sigma-70 family)
MQGTRKPSPPLAAPAATWDEVYAEFGERVFRILHRMTRCREVAADLTHDTFVRVFEKMHLYDGRGALGAWVFRIARNLALDHLKRRHPFVDVEGDVEGAGEGPSGAIPPVDSDTRLTVEAALAEIPDANRTVLLLFDMDGFTHDEIARMLDIATGTSKARLSRGRSMLRRALGHP